jgi:TPR repeat protein
MRAGYRYLTGLAGKIDREQARAYLRPAVSAFPAASAVLAYIDAVDPRISSDAALKADAMRTLKQAADAGEPVAQALLGQLYERKRDGLILEVASAKALYVTAAPKFALAATYLARRHLRARRRQDAVTLLTSAVGAGETYAMADLASVYTRELPRVSRLVKAKQLLRSAAERGDPRGAYQLGVLYYRDGLRGVLGAHNRAFRLFGRAASTGYPPAKAATGLCFQNGIGVARDPGRARYWFVRSAPYVARVSFILGLQYQS